MEMLGLLCMLGSLPGGGGGREVVLERSQLFSGEEPSLDETLDELLQGDGHQDPQMRVPPRF